MVGFRRRKTAIRTGGRAGKRRASSTWSGEILRGRESSVVRYVLAKVASAMLAWLR